MTVTLEEAQAKLTELIAAAVQGEEVVVTKDNHPAARIVAIVETPKRPRPVLGSAQGQILYMAPDFDAPLDDFKDYMP